MICPVFVHVESALFGKDFLLSARDSEQEKVRLLDAGANDYMSKPFGVGEMMARIRVLLRQLRQANDAIPDPVMTAKISRLETLSARIFALAKQDPGKKAQLQKFMDYYLPTALKLLNTYAELSRQDVAGSNISDARQSIERSMDLLVTAFENQLDKLFASDALDVSTDIAALEGMLNLDGLTGGDFAPRS